jgi:hypothetical protein
MLCFIRVAWIGLIWFGSSIWPAFGASEDKPANLLRLPSAALEETSAPKSEMAGLKTLTDDNPATVAIISGTSDAPLDLEQARFSQSFAESS